MAKFIYDVTFDDKPIGKVSIEATDLTTANIAVKSLLDFQLKNIIESKKTEDN